MSIEQRRRRARVPSYSDPRRYRHLKNIHKTGATHPACFSTHAARRAPRTDHFDFILEIMITI